MQKQWSGEEMLEAFRSLGGTAENIRVDENDNRLFARDPEQPVLLHVPENLMFPEDALEFAGSSLRLKNTEGVSQSARDFFARYEHAFGKQFFARAAGLVNALDSLPARVKEVLSEDFGMRESFESDHTCRVETAFIAWRAIGAGERRVFAPVLELAKYDPRGLAINHARGMRIAGPAPNGVRIFPVFHDALAIFQRFGFAAAQPAAFSLPLSFVCDDIEIAIGRKMHLGDRRGEVTVPQLNVVARNNLVLSHMMLGHSRFPRLARGIFRTCMRNADVRDADDHFDRIARENTARLLKLFDVLESEAGETILALRRMARSQLEAMSCSVGALAI